MEALNETVLVTEPDVQQRMTKREVFFKTLVARAMEDNRFAALLMEIMDQYDLIKDRPNTNQMKIVLVGPNDKERKS